MDVENIEYEGRRLGFIIRGHLQDYGREFLSNDDDFLQLGYLHLKQDEWVDPHEHKPVQRLVHKTQKVVYVISGKLGIAFYKKKRKIKEVTLNEQDLIVLLEGGFGFKSLIDNTKIIEIKQGPYLGLEQDKEKFVPEQGEN